MGQSVDNLKGRINEVNDIIDRAHEDVLRCTTMVPDEDVNEAVIETRYQNALGRYERGVRLLVLLTKNYDEAAAADAMETEEEKRKGTYRRRKKEPETLLEKLTQAEQKRGQE